MKIGIDARMLGKGFGLARYVERLIWHLLEIDKENEYMLFVRENNFERPILTPPYQGGNVRTVFADIPWYSLQEQVSFSTIIKREKLDLMHFPHWNIPYFYHDPYVVTIHDLTMYHFPRPEATTLGPVKFWFKDQAHRMLLRKIVRQAKHLLVTSEFTKADVHKTLEVPLEKMTVTYQAPFGLKSQELLLSTYNIQRPYVLYVGAAYPHKNLKGLLEGWKILEHKYGSKYQLVLVGKEDYFYKKLRNTVTMKQCNSVIFTGFLPDHELQTLYQHASLFIFPSLYEGFGLPPLEAMAHGVPVVSSNRTCLPEVLGNAVRYFDPESPEDMAKIMFGVLSHEKIRQELIQKGHERVKKFSWGHLASQTLQVYKSILTAV